MIIHSAWSRCLPRRGWKYVKYGFQSARGTLFKTSRSTTILMKIVYPIELSAIQSRLLCGNFIRHYSTEADKNNIEQKPGQDDSTSEKNEKLSSKDRLKIITTQYGAFGMAFHITISLASLGFFYSLVYMGVDMAAIFQWFGMESSKLTAGASTFMIAYAVHKVFAPVRIGITFVSVPILVKYFRRVGFFKKK